MKYITNDECNTIMSAYGDTSRIKKIWSECSAGCEAAHHVFFEKSKFHRLEQPLIPGCDRLHSFFLNAEFKNGLIKQQEIRFSTQCRYAYDQAYLLIVRSRCVTDELVSVDYGMAKDWSWTAETVWDKENGYHYDLQTYNGELAGIRGSYWAKPVLVFTYIDKDGVESEKWVYCYREVDAIGLERLVVEDANDLD